MIQEKTFREDLYYRINVIPINIPPLRERKSDIKVLAQYFIKKYSSMLKKQVRIIEDEVWECLYRYDWPGNVRELENTIEFMINMMDKKGILSEDNIPKRVLQPQLESYNEVNTYGERVTLENMGILNLQLLEKRALEKALSIYGNSTKGKKDAAEALGIGIATLYRKMNYYNLS